MKRVLVSTVALSAMIFAGSAFAQATTTMTGGTMTTTTTTTKTTTTKAHAARHTATKRKMTRTRTYSDVTRLAANLQEVTQSTVVFSAATWKTVANESNALANRIYAGAAASHDKAAITAAKNLRMHIREMHKAALAGDAAGAKTHAGEALPFAYTIVDWSKPAA
jgi:hypothetical protein